MNAWLQMLGIDFVKPFLAALLLPPVPWLVLIVLGAWQWNRRRWLGLPLLVLGLALEWASATTGAANLVARVLLNPPPALQDVGRLAAPLPAGRSVIVVLGGGRATVAEYPEASLSPYSIERLRYGIWLSRETGLPWGFSGGLSPGSDPGPTEAAIATRIARDEFRHPLQWAEDRSRDTHENAVQTVDLLRRQGGVGRVVLVTHDLHMPRAFGHFQRARDAAGLRFDLVAAPVGQSRPGPSPSFSDFYPSAQGIARTRYALREWLGLLAGA
jgi:uncharacterized SAM-binding protein YcdF (DUF218 family)